MRIRFFNTYEPVTTLYRDLLPALAGHGGQVEVYISAAEYRSGRGPVVKALNHANLSIKFLPTMGILPTGRLQKAWLMLTYAFGAALHSLFSPPVDINIFLSQPPLFALWGWVLKIIRRQRYFCLLMDLYPDAAIRGGLLRENGLTARMLEALAQFTWKQADGIVVIGRCQKEKLIQLGITGEKIRFIPNWANDLLTRPVARSRNHFRKELGLRNSFVILYSGNMGIPHDFRTILDAAEQLSAIPHLQFVFFGDGSRRPEVEAGIRAKKLKNVTLLPFQSPESLAESLSLGDVHIVTLRSGFEGLVVPSKAYAAQAVGRPLIYLGHASGEIGRMLRESRVGAVVAAGDTAGLTRSILRYYHNPSLRRAHGKKAWQLHKQRSRDENPLFAYQELLLGSQP